MAESKAWDWEQADSPIWKEPSEEGCFAAERWQAAGYRDLLDLGCGLGRHAVLFAKRGFRVSALDLSPLAVESLRRWAKAEGVSIALAQADM